MSYSRKSILRNGGDSVYGTPASASELDREDLNQPILITTTPTPSSPTKRKNSGGSNLRVQAYQDNVPTTPKGTRFANVVSPSAQRSSKRGPTPSLAIPSDIFEEQQQTVVQSPSQYNITSASLRGNSRRKSSMPKSATRIDMPDQGIASPTRTSKLLDAEQQYKLQLQLHEQEQMMAYDLYHQNQFEKPKSAMSADISEVNEENLKTPITLSGKLVALEYRRYITLAHNKRQKHSRLSWLLFIIQLGVFIGEIISEGGFANVSMNPMLGPSPRVLMSLGGNVPDLVRKNFSENWWRVIWACFLHAGVVHFFINVFAEWSIFPKLEHYWGWPRALATLLVTGTAGNLTAAMLQQKAVVTIGASGMITGGMGALVGDTIKNWHSIFLPKWQLGYWFINAAILLLIGLIPVFDNLVHSSAFLIGIFFSFCLTPFLEAPNRKWTKSWKAFYVILGAVPVLTFFIAALTVLAQGKLVDCPACCHLFMTISCKKT